MPPTLLIGRERTEAAVLDLLQKTNGPRLLTLTGPGGVGKTRLALAVAAFLGEAYADGVCFIDLSAVRDPPLVAATLAQALGLRERDGQPVYDLLVAYLRDQQWLLVLDNFEQVLDAAPIIADLLARCPRLVLLVTSRAALRVRGEQQFRVPPLAVPPSGRAVAPETAAGYPAVQLFVARAQAIQPDFTLSAANAAAVAQICARLERRLTVLRDGARDLPARQRTLRATLDWSYDLLDMGEQALFARLGVFAGGAPLAAIAAICTPDDEMETLDIVAALADMSLVLPIEGGNEPRTGMLATLREYARDRLEERGEATRFDQAHAAYYLALAEAAEPMLTGAEQGAWLDRIEREHDNLRAALERALAREEATTTLRLAGALWPFWEARGYLDEGRRWLTRALAMGGAVVPALRGKALRGAGLLATWQGDYTAARHLHEESLALYQSLNDRRGIANALENLGLVTREQGHYAAAQALHEESLAIRRALGDRRGAAISLINLGIVAYGQGDYAAAQALHQESLRIKRALGGEGIAESLEGLAAVAGAWGEVARAARLLGAADALRAALARPQPSDERADQERWIARARATCAADAWHAAWQLGRAMPVEEIITEALDDEIIARVPHSPESPFPRTRRG